MIPHSPLFCFVSFLELTKALSAAVNSLMADGTMKKLFRQYGLDETMVLDTVVVNQAMLNTGLN